jgi:hypothetical protein
MHIFARFHGGGHSGQALHWSDFVSSDNGQPHYHLIPLILLTGVILALLVYFWVLLITPDYSVVTIPSWFLVFVGVVLATLAVACCILVQYPQFSLF